jgi:branched-chain amino acid transport system ATP-binding protein
MLKVSGIEAFYGDYQALWGLSMEQKAGEIVTLVGSNGAGKSTFLKTIAGLHKLKTGTIDYQGIRLDQLPAHKIVRLGIAMVPEGRRIWPEMSVLEHLEVGAFHHEARRTRDAQMSQVYEIFPVMIQRAGQYAGTLSGGEQQMLAIGRALMSKPRLLLIDEMSLGLAPLLMQECARVIKRLNETSSLTILLVEQNVRLALKIAHRGYILENGRIVDQGDARDLMHSESVREAYLGVDPLA